MVVTADAGDLRLPRRPFHVVANPPFGIARRCSSACVHPGSRLIEAHLVLQLQVARRWAAPDAPGGAAMDEDVPRRARAPVPRSAFHPRPGVDSRVLVLRRR